MNKKLQVPDEDLPRVLGEILQPEPYKHKTSQSLKEMAKSAYRCANCGEKQYEVGSHCPVPDPIPLTPANAFKWRDWAVAEYKSNSVYGETFERLYKERHLANGKYTIYSEAEPVDYLLPAAECKLNHKEKSNG